MNQTTTTDAATILRDALKKIQRATDNGEQAWKTARDALAAAQRAAIQTAGEAVAVVDEGDEGIFVDIIYGPDGSTLKRGDRLYLGAQQEAKAEQVRDSEAGELPPLPNNPEPEHVWTNLERLSIYAYGQLCRDTERVNAAQWKSLYEGAMQVINSNTAREERAERLGVAPSSVTITETECEEAISNAVRREQFDSDEDYTAACSSVTSAPTAPSTGSIGDDAEFRRLLDHCEHSCDADEYKAAYCKLAAYTDARSPVAAAPEWKVCGTCLGRGERDTAHGATKPCKDCDGKGTVRAPTASTPPAPAASHMYATPEESPTYAAMAEYAPAPVSAPVITDKNAKGYRPACCDGGREGSTCCDDGCVADRDLAEMGLLSTPVGDAMTDDEAWTIATDLFGATVREPRSPAHIEIATPADAGEFARAILKRAERIGV